MTTPNPTPEALQRKEAEKMVIQAAMELHAAKRYEFSEKAIKVVEAVDRLLSSPSEPQPTTGDQQAEEFEGWEVWQSPTSSAQLFGKHSHGFWMWAIQISGKLSEPIPVTGDWPEWMTDEHKRHGPARLEVIRSLPPEILKAAKGGKS